METVQPSKEMIFAKPIEKENKTASGLLLVDSAADNLARALVINVGEGIRGCQRDDIIIYREYSATPTKVNGDDFLLIEGRDVIGKVVKVEV